MTYIKLEDVQKILDINENKYIYWETAILEIEKQINSLSTINPEEIIEKEISYYESINTYSHEDEKKRMDILYFAKELLQKFKS